MSLNLPDGKSTKLLPVLLVKHGYLRTGNVSRWGA
jgi:hypothetical protein